MTEPTVEGIEILTAHLNDIVSFAESEITDSTAQAVLVKSVSKLLTSLKAKGEVEKVNRYATLGLDPREACRGQLVKVVPAAPADMTYPQAVQALTEQGWIAGLPMGKTILYRFSKGNPIARS